MKAELHRFLAVVAFACAWAGAPAGRGSVARADTLLTTFPTFMHSGPDHAYAVVDEIPTQTAVDLVGCNGGWCQVRYGAAFGWVAQKMLSTGTATAQPQPGARPVECVEFARTGWPHSGDLDSLCLYPPSRPPLGPTPSAPPSSPSASPPASAPSPH